LPREFLFRSIPLAVIALLDLDAFFAQAEQIRRPELRGRPVVVGGRTTDRSVVASSSYEARARGVKTAMPIAQALRLCPDAAFLRGDFAWYAELSRRMHEVCLEHTPIVEKVSLDEAFLDLSGCRRHYRREAPSDAAWPLAAACRLQQHLHETTGLVSSIGIATNRVLAKISSELAKPGGVLWVPPGGEQALLSPLPIRHLPGVGPKTAARLKRYNLQTIGDLAGVSRELLVELFGEAGQHFYDVSRGRGSSKVSPEVRLPKSISRETTFEHDTCDRHRLAAMLSYLLQRACRQLRGDNLLAATVTLKLRYSDFQTMARSRTLAEPTDHDDAFYAAIMDLLPKTYTRRVAIRLVGVCLSGLSRAGRQLLLFDETSYQRRSRLYASMDAVRERFGFSSLVTSRALDLLATHKPSHDGFELPVACLSR
jgi:DNA polymerase IV